MSEVEESPGPLSNPVLAGFEQHLRVERARAELTITSYLSDLRVLNVDLRDAGVTSVDHVILAHLRSFLAGQASAGLARSSISRRAASIKTFFAWAHGQGYVTSDPAVRLKAPTPDKHLPGVLAAGQAATLMDLAAVVSDDDDPVHIRD
ncbi:MAG: site-specific integrase, partial [Ornithinimicrobium sp.]